MITTHKQYAVLRFHNKKDVQEFKDSLRFALRETQHASETNRKDRLLLRTILSSLEGNKL